MLCIFQMSTYFEKPNEQLLFHSVCKHWLSWWTDSWAEVSQTKLTGTAEQEWSRSRRKERKRWQDEKKWWCRKEERQIQRVFKDWLMTCITVCPLGDGERKPTLLLQLSDDTSQLAASISLPTKLPDRQTLCFLKAICECEIPRRWEC